MHNFQVSIVSNINLKEILFIAFGNHKKASCFTKTNQEFCLYWFQAKGSSPLPVQMTSDDVFPIIQKWLKEEAIYPDHPDMDGSCESNAFKITANGGCTYSILKVEPDLALYPK